VHRREEIDAAKKPRPGVQQLMGVNAQMAHHPLDVDLHLTQRPPADAVRVLASSLDLWMALG
jgi:hypothetical protein